MLFLDAMKTVIPHKVSENGTLLSNLMGLCGDIRLVLTQSHQLEIDWDTMWKSSPSEETAILEMAEKEFESFGKCTKCILKWHYAMLRINVMCKVEN